MTIYVARVLFPVKVLGPGDRIGIWFAGCSKQCMGCSNPELWEQKPEWKTTVDCIVELVKQIASMKTVDGFTLTGGDPFEQPDALAELIHALKEISEDILIYTGYSYEMICARFGHVLGEISVLVDGPYVEQRNQGQRLRGSDNQRIIFKDPKVRGKYERYLAGDHADIQNFSVGNSIISVGIHLPDYAQQIKLQAEKKGLISDE